MVYVFLANGFEIIEALAPVDVMKRAGIEVKTVGVGSKTITSSCLIDVVCDISIDKFDFYNVEAIVLPGGMPGTLNLEADETVQQTIDNAMNINIPVCAICAAPSILGHKGLLKGKKAVCCPGFEKDLEGAKISSKHVVCDGNIITAKGAGVCVDFGLEIVKKLRGEKAAETVKKQIQCR